MSSWQNILLWNCRSEMAAFSIRTALTVRRQKPYSIFRVCGMNSSYLSVKTSTGIITDNNKYDVIIIDESHKLSRKYGKQHPSFGKVYEIPEFANCQSHLEILQRMGQQIILMYDVLQAIRPANITREMFRSLTAGYEKKFLKTSFGSRLQRVKITHLRIM